MAVTPSPLSEACFPHCGVSHCNIRGHPIRAHRCPAQRSLVTIRAGGVGHRSRAIGLLWRVFWMTYRLLDASKLRNGFFPDSL